MTNHYVATVPRQVHRHRWPGAHPFSARGCDVPQHPQRGWLGVLQPQARLPGRGLGAGDVPAEREGSPRTESSDEDGLPQDDLGAARSLFQGCRVRRSDRPRRLHEAVGRCAFNGRTPPEMIRPRQGGQSASRGPSTKTYRPGPPGFCGRDLASQIWPALTLTVRPVGGVCARPRFRPNTCVFVQTLGGCWRRGL